MSQCRPSLQERAGYLFREKLVHISTSIVCVTRALMPELGVGAEECCEDCQTAYDAFETSETNAYAGQVNALELRAFLLRSLRPLNTNGRLAQWSLDDMWLLALEVGCLEMRPERFAHLLSDDPSARRKVMRSPPHPRIQAPAPKRCLGSKALPSSARMQQRCVDELSRLRRGTTDSSGCQNRWDCTSKMSVLLSKN